jgi:hypothetical protein
MYLTDSTFRISVRAARIFATAAGATRSPVYAMAVVVMLTISSWKATRAGATSLSQVSRVERVHDRNFTVDAWHTI